MIRRVLWLALATLGTAASATVVGELSTGSAGTITIMLDSIAFSSDPSAVPPGPPWNSEVASGTNITFTGGPLATREGVQVFSPLTSSTPLPITTYLQFAAHSSLIFSLIAVGPGSPNTNCAALSIGASCSIFAGSPLVLTRSATGTTITFAVSGKASDSGVAGLASGSDYQGAFAAPVAGKSPQQIQLFFCPSGTCTMMDFSSGNSLTTSQSGDFLAVAPNTPMGTPTNTPTNTPTSTPTATPTSTPTATPALTPTATSTRVPAGSTCTDTAQCAPALFCVEGVCSAVAAPAPAVSRLGLLLALGALIAIAAASLRGLATRSRP